MMGVTFDELEDRARVLRRRTANFNPDGLLRRRFSGRPGGVLPQPDQRRAGLAHAPFRHSRLRHRGAHRLRLGRPGARHGAQGDAPRPRGLHAGRRLRFDAQPDRACRRFCLLGALSTDNETPERASRPFDATRNGFVLGEGAGFLVLEEWEAARKRGARIYAELAGDGNSLSSYRITDSPSVRRRPDPGHATGAGRRGPDAGIRGLRECPRHFHVDERPQRMRRAARGAWAATSSACAVSSTKSCMGHLIAAAGAVEAGVCALAIRDGIAPVNANLRPARSRLRREHRARRIAADAHPRRALQSLGFGGSNSARVSPSGGGADAMNALPTHRHHRRRRRLRRGSDDRRDLGRDRERPFRHQGHQRSGTPAAGRYAGRRSHRRGQPHAGRGPQAPQNSSPAPTCSASTPPAPAIQQFGHCRPSRHARRRGGRAVQRPQRGVRRLGRRQLPQQLRFLPAADRRRRRSPERSGANSARP